MQSNEDKNNNLFYILGMASIMSSAILLFLSIYILPYLIWELRYDIPYIIVDLVTMFSENYGYTVAGSKLLVWLIFFIPSVILGCVSYLISKMIDRRTLPASVEEEERSPELVESKKETYESIALGLKIVVYMVLVVVLLLFLQFIL